MLFPDRDIDLATDGAERWFYGGEPPPPRTDDTDPPGQGDEAPDRVREPDDRQAPPVREPRQGQPAVAGCSVSAGTVPITSW